MLIEKIIEVIYYVLDYILPNIPHIPDDAMGYIDTAVEYLQTGCNILATFAPMSYLLTLLGVIVTIDICLALYHLILWILKKIPMIGVE